MKQNQFTWNWYHWELVNLSQWTILKPLYYSSFFFATLVYGVIGYKFCWLLPQSRSTSWTRISWDTNWALIKRELYPIPLVGDWMTCSPCHSTPISSTTSRPEDSVSKFTMYDGTGELFDHIMHFRQLMTLDMGNDALICKVFPPSLHCLTLSWFHRLSPNSMNMFQDISKAFVGHYLCFAHQKQNISTL